MGLPPRALPRVLSRTVALATLAFATACSTGDSQRLDAIEDFVEEHYAVLTVGADWDQVRRDFTSDATINRMDDDHPGAEHSTPVGEFFVDMGPAIDSMQSFTIVPQGVWITLYDRIATVWVAVEVESVQADGSVGGFSAIDQLSLILDEDDRWRISHLLYQHTVDGWSPPHRDRRKLYTGDGAVSLELRVAHP